MATMQDNQTWSGRFNEPVAELVKRYTASVDFDKRLALFDIQGRLVYQRRWEATGSGIDRIPFDAGRPVRSGVYFLRAVDASGSQSEPAKIVLLR